MTWAVSVLGCGTKYRPRSTFPAQSSVTLHCARGQWACFQIAVRASAEDVTGVNVTATAPTGWRDLTIFREVPYFCQIASRSDGAVGEWPDALVPKTDVFYGEERSSFPFDVNRVSPVYHHFCLGKGSEAPVYRANDIAKTRPTISGTFSGAGPIDYVIEIDKAGGLGTATFRWSDDAGATWDGANVAIANTNPISLNNGLSVSFPDQTYDCETFTKVFTLETPSTYADETTDAGDTGTADVTLPQHVGDMIYFGNDTTFGSVHAALSTAGIGGAITWEYYNGFTSGWTALTIRENLGSKHLTGALNKLTWTKPTTTAGAWNYWAKTTINGYEGYFVRARITTEFSTAPVGSVLNRYGGDAWAVLADTARTELVWVEAYIPESVTPGSYTMTAQVTATNGGSPKTAVDLTVPVTVHQCQIPITSTFKTLYYSSNGTGAVQQAHVGSQSTNNYVLTGKYMEAGLRNRINIQYLCPIPVWNGTSITNWTTYRDWILPFANGTGGWAGKLNLLPLRQSSSQYIFGYLRNANLQGVEHTSVPNWSTKEPFGLTASEQAYLAAYAAGLTAAGIGTTPYVECVEEPSITTADAPLSPPFTRAVSALKTTLRSAMPSARWIISKRFVNQFTGLVDVWLGANYSFTRYPMTLYATDIAGGAEVWSYMGFSSRYDQTNFGVLATNQTIINTDHDAPKLRSYYWLLYDNDVTGDLYSGVTAAYQTFATENTTPRQYDPWDCNDYYGNVSPGGSADGTYFYPGRVDVVSGTGCGPWFPDGIGGTTDIPIETLRLKYLRQGIEDYEIFRWTSNNSDNPYYVKQQIEAAVGNKKCYWDTPPTAANMETARTNILFQKNPPVEEPPPDPEPPAVPQEASGSGGSYHGCIQGAYNNTSKRLRVTAKMWRDNRNG